ncbi:MAG: leucine-rich repeat protein [Prevotella sp.]
MKRLLLFAVFMTLPSLWQYAGAQVTLQAVDAGFTDGKWWIDLKNPGSTDLSGNGGENDKLGICFYIEKSGGQTTTENATTMRWNDQTTWSIAAGSTTRFTETGGRNNNMDGLTVGGTYYLNIKIQDNSALNNKVSVSWANATFKYQGKQNGIYQISDFTKVSGFDVEAGTGTVLEAGKIYRLEQGTVYTFKNGKTITELWSDAKGSNDKIFTFGWFDTDGKFLGVSGNYEIKNPVETGRAGYNGKYYDIIPVANQGATEVQYKYEHLQYKNGTELDFTNGALYLGGSKDGFGIPEANGTYGWNGGDTDTNVEIKGSAIPQIGAGKYQFDISTGSQVNAWGDEGEPLLFKIYHYKRWSLPMGDSKDTFTNFEFKHNSGNATFEYGSKTYNQTFYHVEKNTEASPLGGMFEVTRSADPALGNGNIHGIAIGQDSDLPKFPNGYTFRFNLDLTQNAWDFPLQVSLKQRPYGRDVDGTETWHAGDFTTKTGNVGEIKVCLNNNKKEKRISLRDALRLDWNIPYANSNPYDAENAVKIDKITVTGNMSVDDLYYLGDLVSAGKIANIDLSKASVEGNQIPAGFASMKDDETLKEIILPRDLETIGAEAFKGCKALAKVIFQEGTGDVMIGSGAFMDCKALENVQIQNIINHADAVIASDTFNGTKAEDITLANDITYIGKQAFANTNLKRLTLPATCEGKKVEVESYENWVMPGAIGKVFVKSAYSSGKVDENAARKARTIGGDTESLTLQAEDFNQGYGVGWFNNGDHDDRSEAKPVINYHIDITDEKKGFGIFASNPDYKLGYMGLDYWFNYSFRVMDEGDYILSAYMATGNGQTVTPSFSIDGGEKVATEVKDGNWNPTQEYSVGSVHLTPGIHYVTFHGVKDSDIDKLVLKKGTGAGIPVITPGQNHGRVVTEYKFTHTTNPVSILSSDKDAFRDVNANNCEVVFPDGTTDEMVNGYRDGKNNAGILGLLTKAVSEDDPYDVVYQEHADVKATRTFNKKKWNSVVFPFTVNGKILKNATSEDGTLAEPFARAAYLFDNGFGTPGYDVKLRFVYLDNKNTFDENGKEEIKAGTPFLLFVDDTKDAPAGNVYVFKDITTPAASTTVGMGYSDDKVVKKVDPAAEKDITDYSFEGRLDYKTGATPFIDKIYWVADSKYYWGKNVTMKNMRSWFEPKTEAGARAIESLFGFVGDDATGISIVEANGGGNVNGGIYSLCGRLISTDPASLPRLPKGVYIVNGNKVIVK